MSAAKKGFTLIELLVVIAILMVLAVVFLTAVNPQEQLARTRDAGRTSTVTQLGHAMQAFATAHEGEYMDTSGGINCGASAPDWMQCLVDAGEIASYPSDLPENISGAAECGVNGYNGYCYVTNLGITEGIIFARLESGSNLDRCSTVANTVTYIGFDSVQGRGGLFCHNPTLEAGIAPGSETFIN